MPTLKVKICMGSSCFSRGNQHVLPELQKLASRETAVTIQIEGMLCNNKCNNGPILWIDEQCYNGLDSKAAVKQVIEVLKGRGES